MVRKTVRKKVSKKPLSSLQNEYIARGDALTDQLATEVLRGLGLSGLKHTSKKDYIIVGPTGVGKSWTVKNTAIKSKRKLIEIFSVSSMSNLAARLAVAVYLSKGEMIYVWLDDCDSIFKDRDSLSVMKGALDKDRNIFAWNKNLTSQIQIYESSTSTNDNLIAKALRHYQPVGNSGVEIPTDKITFIITSNHFLTSSNPPPQTSRGKDEAAVRSRVAYKEYVLDSNESWGWMASIILSNPIRDLSIDEKYILIDWMYNVWSVLPDISMRYIDELIDDMLNFPDTFTDHWERRLVRK